MLSFVSVDVLFLRPKHNYLLQQPSPTAFYAAAIGQTTLGRHSMLNFDEEDDADPVSNRNLPRRIRHNPDNWHTIGECNRRMFTLLILLLIELTACGSKPAYRKARQQTKHAIRKGPTLSAATGLDRRTTEWLVAVVPVMHTMVWVTSISSKTFDNVDGGSPSETLSI